MIITVVKSHHHCGKVTYHYNHPCYRVTSSLSHDFGFARVAGGQGVCVCVCVRACACVRVCVCVCTYLSYASVQAQYLPFYTCTCTLSRACVFVCERVVCMHSLSLPKDRYHMKHCLSVIQHGHQFAFPIMPRLTEQRTHLQSLFVLATLSPFSPVPPILIVGFRV